MKSPHSTRPTTRTPLLTAAMAKVSSL
jgi:hypothetical protein